LVIEVPPGSIPETHRVRIAEEQLEHPLPAGDRDAGAEVSPRAGGAPTKGDVNEARRRRDRWEVRKLHLGAFPLVGHRTTAGHGQWDDEDRRLSLRCPISAAGI